LAVPPLSTPTTTHPSGPGISILLTTVFAYCRGVIGPAARMTVGTFSERAATALAGLASELTPVQQVPASPPAG
jgi:hypothetical protein